MHLCGEVASGEQALKAASALRPDVVLMDVHMPGMDGPVTTAQLLKQHPDTKVIAWTVSESSDDLLRMMQAGCSGYVLKDVGPSELQRAIWAAVRSESPVPRKMIPAVLRRVAVHAPMAESIPVALTSREIGLAIPTVETHLGNLYRKLSVGNRGEAVSAGLRLNLISLADV